MKQSIAILLVFTFSIIETDAQINLEHTFNNQSSIFHFTTQTQTMYYRVDTSNIYIYNEDYTLYKTISIPIQNNYSHGLISFISSNLFNTDNYIEFCCSYVKSDHTDVKTVIYNENLSVLKTFNSSWIDGIYSTKNSGYRMEMQRYTDYPDNKFVTDVYSLPGSYTTNVESNKVNQIDFPFPNPAKNEIILPYTLNEGKTTEMVIFNSNGQVIDSFEIGYHFNKVRLNISSYSPGIYFYRYNGKTNKFIVQ